jgi:hypothetical protein
MDPAEAIQLLIDRCCMPPNVRVSLVTLRPINAIELSGYRSEGPGEAWPTSKPYAFACNP